MMPVPALDLPPLIFTPTSTPQHRIDTIMKTPGFSDATQVWNERFNRPDYIFGTEPNAWLASHRDLLVADRHALCVADGEGRNRVWLARQGLQVDAFDISPVGVAKARKLARASGVSVNFHVADCDAWPFQADACDYVVAIFIQFADPAMRARLFANMVRTLKPGGILLLQGYTPKQLEYGTGGPPCAEHLYTEELLDSSFPGLDILELRAYDAMIEEGARHAGMSALIGMVARKKAAT
jgi:SAM-dependent methyltransferase